MQYLHAIIKTIILIPPRIPRLARIHEPQIRRQPNHIPRIMIQRRRMNRERIMQHHIASFIVRNQPTTIKPLAIPRWIRVEQTRIHHVGIEPILGFFLRHTASHGFTCEFRFLFLAEGVAYLHQ